MNVPSGADSTQPPEGSEFSLLWLQKRKVVNDQTFKSYAIFAGGHRESVLTSHLHDKDEGDTEINGEKPKKSNDSDQLLKIGTIVGVLVSIVGFALQFTGLRLMNWSATMAQLIGMVLMTGLRVWIRLDLADRPANQVSPDGYELDWLALQLAREGSHFWPEEGKGCGPVQKGPGSWVIDNRAIRNRGHPPPDAADPDGPLGAWKARQRLGRLSGWRGRSYEMAKAVSLAIECVRKNLGDNFPQEFEWSVDGVWTKESGEEAGQGSKTFRLKFTSRGSKTSWRTDLDEIEAALSLWEYSLSKVSWCPNSAERVRFLGLASQASLRDILWWGGSPVFSLLRLAKVDTANEKIAYALGFQQIEDGPRHFGFPANVRWDPPDDYLRRLQSEPCDEYHLTSFSGRPTVELLAQELFLAFMFAAAKHVGPMPDKPMATMLNSAAITWQSFQLEHSKLQTMVQQIEQTGLATVGEAWTMIVPPLSLERKLPQPDSVIERVREHARDHEVAGHWDQVQRIYSDLLAICKTFGPEDPTYYKAASTIMDVFRIVSSTLKLQEGQLRRGDDLTQLRYAKDKLERGIKSLNKGVTFFLAKVYELEGRLDSCDESLKSAAAMGENNNPAAVEFFSRSKQVSDVPTWDMKEWVKKVESADVFGWTPLHYAASYRDDRMRRLLEIGQKPKAADTAEWTPLHYVAEKGDESAISMLLQHGADIDVRGRDGMGPLHCAAREGKDQAVNFLLEAGANEGIRDNSRSTPLHWAAWRGYPTVVVSLLLRGADREARDNYGRTPLHLAAISNAIDIVRELLLKPNAMAKDRDGNTALHLAAQSGNYEVVRLLASNREQTKAQNNYGNTVLHVAAELGYNTTVRLLVNELQVEVETRNNMGMTALHVAAVFGRNSTVQLLVNDLHANVRAKCTIEATALDLATAIHYFPVDEHGSITIPGGFNHCTIYGDIGGVGWAPASVDDDTRRADNDDISTSEQARRRITDGIFELNDYLIFRFHDIGRGEESEIKEIVTFLEDSESSRS